MTEDLDALRQETERTMSEALRKAELSSFLGVRMCKLWFSKNRVTFTLKKGFESVPGKVNITIFGDGNLIFAKQIFLSKTELEYNVSKKYSNLPLKTFKRVSVCIYPIDKPTDVSSPNNLYMLTSDTRLLFPVNYDKYIIA